MFIDIIGYWSAVTFLSACLLFAPVRALNFLLSITVASGAPECDKSAVKGWFTRRSGGPLSSSGGLPDSAARLHMWGGRVALREYEADVGTLASVLVVAASLAYIYRTPDYAGVVDVIQGFSSACSPVFAYVGVVALSLAGVRAATKQVYKAVKLKEKIEEHMEREGGGPLTPESIHGNVTAQCLCVPSFSLRAFSHALPGAFLVVEYRAHPALMYHVPASARR